MRLIDADSIKFNEDCTFTGKGLNEFIKAIPTAYDVDKVVEQLEDYLFERYCIEGDSKIDEIIKAGGKENSDRNTLGRAIRGRNI